MKLRPGDVCITTHSSVMELCHDYTIGYNAVQTGFKQIDFLDPDELVTVIASDTVDKVDNVAMMIVLRHKTQQIRYAWETWLKKI